MKVSKDYYFSCDRFSLQVTVRLKQNNIKLHIAKTVFYTWFRNIGQNK